MAEIREAPTRLTPIGNFMGLRGTIICIGLLLAATLALPGRTITTKYVNDLFIFLDGSYRIWSGQVPNLDFHSSLGPLVFYLPAAGFGLTGSMGAAMPVGMGILVLMLAVVSAEIIGSRMAWMTGLPLSLFLLLIAAAPANPGERIGELSFAMFYNRIGWAALGLLLVMYLPRRARSAKTDLVDGICASFLVLLMLYTKITYGVVQLAFLVFMLSDRHQFRWVLQALLTIVTLPLLIELIWQGGGMYLSDIRSAAEVSGGLPTAQGLADVVSKNLHDIVVYGIFACILVIARRRFRDVLYIVFCATTGLLIIDQNFQFVGILTLGASASVIADLLLRSQLPIRYRALARGLPFLLVMQLLPATFSNAATLGIHAGTAISGNGERISLGNLSGIRLVKMWDEDQYRYFHLYNETLADGAAALWRIEPAPQPAVVLDFVNPFSAGMPLPAPEGDSVWYHWGRTLHGDSYPPAEELFAHAKFILDPKSPIEIWTALGMRNVYAGYIAEHYTLAVETEHWRIYQRRR